MHNKNDVHAQIVAILSDVVLSNFLDIKEILRIDTYDATIVMLFITAETRKSGGVTESDIVAMLTLTRSTVNRIVKRLIDVGIVEKIGTQRPRKIRRLFSHASKAAGEPIADSARLEHFNILATRQITALTQVLSLLLKSQYGKS